MNQQYIESQYANSNKVNIFSNYNYSKNSSMKALESFIKQVGYSDKTQTEIKTYASRTHQLFPSILWLQKAVDEEGLVSVGKKIMPTSAKGTVYLHFLVMINLLDIKFLDYYKTNPTTLRKLHNWYKPYHVELGIVEVLEAVKYIATNTKNRNLNSARCETIGEKTLIYLIMKYHLKHIRALTYEQWQIFISDCRQEKSIIQNEKRGIADYTNVEIMQMAFFNLGIFNKLYPGNPRGRTKHRIYEDMPYIEPIVNIYLKHCQITHKKSTIQHYKNAIESFCYFIIDKYSVQFKLKQLKRKDVVEYMNFLFREHKEGKFAHSALESKALGLKVFLQFIDENKSDLKKEKLHVFEKSVVIPEDFKTPHIVGLPKPLKKQILTVLLDMLKAVDDPTYQLVFLVMITTGIARTDILHLKKECLQYDKSKNEYLLSYYRVKVKKEVQVKITKEAAQYIQCLQKLDTQVKPLPHPDGSLTIYLLNDGGKKMSDAWLQLNYVRHKEIAIQNYPGLKNELERFTLHKLRHTFASIMREKGADILTLKHLLGHSNINTTMKYVRESDQRKIELIKNLTANQYQCDAMPHITLKQLEQEEGLILIENMLKIENRLLIGKCTINGHKNCPMAFKCIDCMYLCSTKEDLPEMLEMIEALKKQYDELSEELKKRKNKTVKQELENETSKCKRRIQILYKKIDKIQKINTQVLEDESDMIEKGILSFI